MGLFWGDDDDPDKWFKGAARSCQVLDGAGPLTVSDVVYEETRRIRRTNADALRKMLIGLDGCCSLSGERTEEALDVAHIFEVHQAGGDSSRNIILLRADLHRLFDRGRLAFSPTTGEPTFSGLGASSHYVTEFGGRALPKKVLARVTEALKARASRSLRER